MSDEVKNVWLDAKSRILLTSFITYNGNHMNHHGLMLHCVIFEKGDLTDRESASYRAH